MENKELVGSDLVHSVNPKISVIVTTYNRENYLKDTLKSILNQTYSDFELIVVDNFSNYDFFKVIEELSDPRIHPYQNNNEGIIAVNRNYGISKARGQYLAFCDDDDLWVTEKLGLEIDRIESGDFDLVWSNMYLFEGDLNIFDQTHCKRKENEYDFYKTNGVMTSSVLVRNTPLVRFDTSRSFITVEDYLLWSTLYMEGYKMDLIEKPLIYYRCANNNASLRDVSSFNLRKICVIASLKIRYPRLSTIKTIFYLFKNLIRYSLIVLTNTIKKSE